MSTIICDKISLSCLMHRVPSPEAAELCPVEKSLNQRGTSNPGPKLKPDGTRSGASSHLHPEVRRPELQPTGGCNCNKAHN